jgi:hypothetical protein
VGKYGGYLICLLIFPGLKVFSQDSLALKADSPCVQKDLPQLILEWRKKLPSTKKAKDGMLISVPSIGSNPANGFMVGVAGQYAYRPPRPGSLYSLVSASVTVTTKKQVIVQLKNNIFTKNNRIFLSGDWRFLIFSQPTYGLGTNAPEDGVLAYQYGLNGTETSNDSLAQPMKFNHARIHQTVSWKLKESVYLGFGYHFDYHYSIVDEKLDTLAPLLTSHYTYSKKYGFNEKNYAISGVSANFVIDTRDNMINAYKGFFANVNYKFYPDFMGNEKDGNVLYLEWRSFHGLSRKNPRHLLSFWMMGNFTFEGQMPYLDLPSLGYDQRGRAGRGYTQGRYRGQSLLYSEAEYRFPISQCGGVLGGVLFVNATTADRPDGTTKLFDYVAPGYGAGLRLMVDKRSRTNLQLDVGFGKGSSGFYLGATETF